MGRGFGHLELVGWLVVEKAVVGSSRKLKDRKVGRDICFHYLMSFLPGDTVIGDTFQPLVGTDVIGQDAEGSSNFVVDLRAICENIYAVLSGYI
ncbi:hypothetical protein AVEN_211055-1 [Araneus ventricosus]|uniref:Uncharacterized protein n=1 Tax=Araneus ventricosus TaxID=182803 RepID=A0A4Y2RA98_ARAVE|nr:hypothetical protein AVEN_211055-1 [Araneus ventricosus]